MILALILLLVMSMTCSGVFAAETGDAEAGTAGELLTGTVAEEGLTPPAEEEEPAEPVNLADAKITLTRDLTTADLDDSNKAVDAKVLASVIKVKQGDRDITDLCTFTSTATISTNGNSVTVTVSITDGDGVNVINSTVKKAFVMKTHMSDCIIGIIDRQVYSGSELKPTINVLHTQLPITLNPDTDFSVEFKNNKNAGFATVMVTGKGNYVGSISRYFEIEPKNLEYCSVFYTNGRASSSYTGEAVMPLLTVRDGAKTLLTSGKDYIVSYADTNGKTVPVMKNKGKYQVIVTGLANYSGTWTLPYEISGIDISDYTIDLRYDSVKADGSSKMPEILSVKDENTSVLLPEDYDVSWLNAHGTVVTELRDPGIYQVVVTGKNGFGGSTSATFEIVGQDQGLTLAKTSYKVYKKSKDFTITPESDNPDVVYTFVSSDPDVASVDENGVVNVHKLGRAKITVTASGSSIYNPASKDVFVKVYPYKAVLTRKPWTDGAKKSFKVRWETQADVTYYQVRYSTTKTFKSGTYKTKKVDASSKNYATQSTKITGLKSGKTYYVKVRAVKVAYNDAGKKVYYYGNWSGWKSVKTK